MKADIDGVIYGYDIRGDGIPVLLLHGFSQNRDSWAGFSPAGLRLVVPDIIGHGQTECSDPRRYEMASVIEDLVKLMDVCDMRRFGIIGYSMGGRIASELMQSHPDRIIFAVFESSHPGPENDIERKVFGEEEKVLSDKIGNMDSEGFEEYWSSLPIFNTQDALPPGTREKISDTRCSNDTGYLSMAVIGMGKSRMRCLYRFAEKSDIPMLYISGKKDRKYQSFSDYMDGKGLLAVGSAETGHNVHLESPESFGKMIKGFIDSLQGR